MRSSDIPSGAQREVNAGHVWEEVITGGAGTFEVLPQQTFRVRNAAGGTNVFIGGILAMTMDSEVEYFNAGTGAKGDGKTRVTITVTGGVNFVQVARQIERGRRTK